MQVIEKDGGRLVAADGDQGAAQGLDQRGEVTLRRRRAQLRQEEGEVGRQRTDSPQTVRDGTQVRAQRGNNRPVGCRPTGACTASQDLQAAAVEHCPEQPGLAHTGFAGDDDHASGTRPSDSDRVR